MSKSRSKTPRISKSTLPDSKGFPEESPLELAIGHRPASLLAPQDETLFRAFQSNLLSLISHELRTPLMGVLNALAALEDDTLSSTLSPVELIKMARQNAIKLQHALVSLLDLASLESGTFHARLREVDLIRLVSRWVASSEWMMKDRALEIQLSHEGGVPPVLADPQKFGRVMDLVFQMVASRAQEGTYVQVWITSSKVRISCEVSKLSLENWKIAWAESLAGFESGVSSPFSAFAGVLQSEQAFLVRTEEGLGSELLLIHEIMRLHQGKFTCEFLNCETLQVIMNIELPVLSSEAALKAVLTSRAYEVSTELGSVALVLIQIPAGVKSETFCLNIRKNLFRTTDAVYPLESRGRVALVLDDCKVEDIPGLLGRLTRALAATSPEKLLYATSQCPTDGIDPGALLELAESRLLKHLK